MKKNKDAQIYILAHRKSKIEENSLYTPLQIGASYTKKDIYPLKDNQYKDNISSLNPLYCDVCGTYYIYKNLLKEKYIGVAGVRRYLDINKKEDFDSIFKNYDIILPNYIELNSSIIEQYSICHNKNDIALVTNIINEYFPQYLNTWNKLDKIYAYNCYLTKKEIFQDYCKFLFFILNKLFKELNINTLEDAKKHILNSYNDGLYDNSRFNPIYPSQQDFLNYQLNIGGFLQERLLTLYVVHNKLNILHRNIIFIENYQIFINYEEN